MDSVLNMVDVKFTAPITEEDYIKKILWWIVFTT